jgi:hypothetical protein
LSCRGKWHQKEEVMPLWSELSWKVASKRRNDATLEQVVVEVASKRRSNATLEQVVVESGTKEKK